MLAASFHIVTKSWTDYVMMFAVPFIGDSATASWSIDELMAKFEIRYL
jgi:hypothetical protein